MIGESPEPGRRLNLSLRTKITGLLIFYFFVALIAISATLSISWQLEGSAAAINDAGSERMRSYRIAWLLERYARDRAPALRRDVENEVTRFEQVLEELRHGNPERPLALPHERAIRKRMSDLETAWSTATKPQIMSLLAATPGAPMEQEFAIFRESIQGFVASINDLVVKVEASNARATTLLRSFQIGLVTVAMIGTMLLVYLFSLMVVRPVSRLQEGIRRMAAADFSVRLPVDNHDELGELAEGFNRMVGQLQDLYGTLEQRVTEKTQGIETKSRELATLYEVAAFLNTAGSTEALCEGVLSRMIALFEAQGGIVRLADSAERRLTPTAWRGLSGRFLAAETPLATGECLCGATALNGQSLNRRLEDCGRDLSLDACRAAGAQGIAGVPIRASDRILGMVALVFDTPKTLPPAELRLLEAVGQHLGIAIENNRLVAREKEMAVSEERNLLAQELHDSIAQSLAFLNIQVQMLADAVRRGATPEVLEGLDQIKEGVQQSYDDVRELLLHFRTRVGSADLETTLRNAVERFAAQSGLATNLSFEGIVPDYAPEKVLQVLHIAQEALSNIRKHARASAVTLTLTGTDRGCVLMIADDGVGFDVARDAGDTHVGLRIMRERAHRVGGALSVASKPGKGTCVELALNDTEQARSEKAEAVNE